MLANICFYTQNGFALYDDIARKPIPGAEKFNNKVIDADKTLPLTFMEQYSLAELTAEISTSCYAGVLMLQAMGLGGWMYDGIDRHTILGASGNPAVPGLGFRYDTDERWSLPNPTGLPSVFEGYCPPHYKNMREATEALAKRKFGACAKSFQCLSEMIMSDISNKASYPSKLHFMLLLIVSIFALT